MSEFGPAIKLILQHEGGVFDNPETGEYSNMGLSCAFLRGIGFLGNPPPTGPCTEGEKQVIKSLSVVTAMQIYQKWVWEAQRCGEINDQEVANKYADLCVNQGPEQATKILQRAINDARTTQDAPLAVDGLIGPATIAAANARDPVVLMASIRSEGAAVYREIAAANPQDEQFLSAWLARLNS